MLAELCLLSKYLDWQQVNYAESGLLSPCGDFAEGENQMLAVSKLVSQAEDFCRYNAFGIVKYRIAINLTGSSYMYMYMYMKNMFAFGQIIKITIVTIMSILMSKKKDQVA